MKEIISKENKKKVRHNFIVWMNEKHPNIARPEIMASNVMLSINNDIGFSINDLLTGKITIDEYEKKYIDYFIKIGRKSAMNHASVQKNNARYFIDFFNSQYK